VRAESETEASTFQEFEIPTSKFQKTETAKTQTAVVGLSVGLLLLVLVGVADDKRAK
jgi:hypothetical protein